MFTLDPDSIAVRALAASEPVRPPTLAASIARGTVGFTGVSLGGFGPWVLASRWFHQHGGELGMYAVCAVMFISLSGLLLHGLIIGPGSLGRFYLVFGLAFGAYAIAWTAGWMALGGDAGSLAGLLAGTAAMGAVLAFAFNAHKAMGTVIFALFVSNAFGYFGGGWAHVAVLNGALGLSGSGRLVLAKTVWGLVYGGGFGAGIGFAFYQCQEKARRLLRERKSMGNGIAD